MDGPKCILCPIKMYRSMGLNIEFHDQIKENEVGGTCSTHEIREIYAVF